jgi:flagellar basal body-associated protein FliL
MNIIIVLAIVGVIVGLVVLSNKKSQKKKEEVNNSQVNPIPEPMEGDDTTYVDPTKR